MTRPPIITAEEAQKLLSGITEGPWAVEDAWNVKNDDIVIMSGSSLVVSDDERAANARLCATAPDLARTIIALSHDRDFWKSFAAQNAHIAESYRSDSEANADRADHWEAVAMGLREAMSLIAVKGFSEDLQVSERIAVIAVEQARAALAAADKLIAEGKE